MVEWRGSLRSAIVGVLLLGLFGTAGRAETFEVTLQGISFAYDGQANMDIDLVIRPGDTVRWLWVEGFHNVVSGFPEDENNGELFLSGAPIDLPGNTFEFTFNDPGVYGYHCHPHEKFGMISFVTVAGTAGVPTASQWSVVGLIVMLLAAGTVGVYRRGHQSVASGPG